jgi:hypothetical protein
MKRSKLNLRIKKKFKTEGSMYSSLKNMEMNVKIKP